MHTNSFDDAGEAGSLPSQRTSGLLDPIREEPAQSNLSGRRFSPFEMSYPRESASTCGRRNRLLAFLRQIANCCKCSHIKSNGAPQVIICRGALNVLFLIWTGLVYFFSGDPNARLIPWIFPGGQPSIFSKWVTHGVIPVHCHSHNDYWRPVPLFSAIRAGCIGVEADIWLSGDDLLVGHNQWSLQRATTLRSLYLDPLLSLLERYNTRSSQMRPNWTTEELAGVFTYEPSQTLILLVDFKVDGNDTWPYLLEQLTPLREAGYLTHFNGVELVQRPITVVASGDAPFDYITANVSYRDIFFDAPLDKLSRVALDSIIEEAKSPQEITPNYNYTNSYYASVDFRKTIGPLSRNRFSQEQLDLVRGQVAAAHDRGLKVRYWGTPTWPRGLRDHVWRVLIREQVDFINVDDLGDQGTHDRKRNVI
ncbi:hypothetical protein IFM53868_09336 [Aspergillus udagawae]|uniref:Altered inheritance of mitochondria protein 6 n=1 Tax=Aspergillus udagawae TaxID=91492 RepID=A0ABQ1BB87_9EURO|nr:hypothetical protein IFM53868_09336 [Aspergillus udagawae]